MSVKDDGKIELKQGTEPCFDQVAVDGERLRVAIAPGTGVPLVICNNLAANLELLDDFVAVIGRPTLRFDMPGVGGSAPVSRMRRMAGVAALLAALLDALSLTGQVDLMGIGWGGLLAQRFVRDHGERVRRLVLAGTSGGQFMFPGRLTSLRRLSHPASLTRVAPTAGAARAVFGGRRNDECNAIAAAMSRATTATRRGYAAQIYALTGFTSLPWLHRIMKSTLILAGDDDPIVPMVNARVLALLMPRARLKVLRGAGHWFVLERTGEVVRLLDGFLGARAAPGASERDTLD
jgi:poly(3-hydroxyalkanoate) depolymerase